jgi:hypothetical protein
LNAANTTPHPKPVSIDKIISFTYNPFLLTLYDGLNRHL